MATLIPLVVRVADDLSNWLSPAFGGAVVSPDFDGVEALAFLRREDDYAEAATPDLILLDLNLPKKDGREVLAEIKSDQCLRKIPVVILTTSRAEEDIVRSYKLHANCYITKPLRFQQFIDVVKHIEQFWFTIVALPTGRSP